MTFSLTNIRSFYRSKPLSEQRFDWTDKVTLVLDMLLVAGLIGGSVVLLTGSWPTSDFALGKIESLLPFGALGIAIVITLADGTVLGIRVYPSKKSVQTLPKLPIEQQTPQSSVEEPSNSEKPAVPIQPIIDEGPLTEEEIEQLVTAIKEAQKEEIDRSKLPKIMNKDQISSIYGGITIGNYKQFRYLKKEFATSDIQTVITCCRLCQTMESHEDDSMRDVTAKSFSEKNITWLNIGVVVNDADLDSWYVLASNCTFPFDSETQEDISTHWMGFIRVNDSREEFESQQLQRKEKIKDIPVTQWFEPTFHELDQGIRGKRIFVHCYAGVLRSALVLIAYLVNRCRGAVSVDQVIHFLQVRRPQIEVKEFLDPLNEYANTLLAEQH